MVANTKVCTLSHQQFDQAKNQRLLAIELTSRTGEEANGTIALPFGLELSAGVTLSVEEKPAQTKMPFKTCFAVGCLVPVNWEKTFVDRLKANKALKISAVASDTQQPVSFTVSLRGFSSAIARAAELAKDWQWSCRGAACFFRSRSRQMDVEARTVSVVPPGGSSLRAALMSAATIPSPIPVPPVSRQVVKKGSKMRARLLGEMPGPSSAAEMATDPSVVAADNEKRPAPCRAELSIRLASTIAAFSGDILNRISAPPSISMDRSGFRSSTFSASASDDVSLVRLELSARAKLYQAPNQPVHPVGVGDDIVMEAGLRGPVHIVTGVRAKFCGALDRRQRRLQLVRDVGRERLDGVGTRLQFPRHIQKGRGQFRHFLGSVMAERTYCIAVSRGDACGPVNEARGSVG